MKPLIYLSLLLTISATTALAALRPDATPDEVAAAEAECGSLGVMRIDPAELSGSWVEALQVSCAVWWEQPFGNGTLGNLEDDNRI
ncbi:hypothetical protein BDV33DRAFT_197733 [Aspergillus novoparasiticus]|uniref:Uncharacterized protein n=1 Tax=Aspergillus novoparasiticus TaxID=986946 RepID=A0A5N6FC61_9EURO|nr:hypothetical protein BDV33DRAFT_197733 [Aspergillus novoparasiticus]